MRPATAAVVGEGRIVPVAVVVELGDLVSEVQQRDAAGGEGQ
jgi:hypothetical protein